MDKLGFFKKLKKFSKKEVITEFAKNLGLKELVNETPKIEILKKLDEENEKIKHNLNIQLKNLMKERQKIRSYIGTAGDGINSIEELQQIKRLSIEGEFDVKNKQKKKFSTSITNQKLSFKKSKFTTIINNNKKKKNTLSPKLPPLKDNRKLNLSVTPSKHLFDKKKKSVHFTVEKYNPLNRRKSQNNMIYSQHNQLKRIASFTKNNQINRHYSNHNLFKYSNQSILENLKRESKKEMISIGLNKGLSSVEKLKQLTNNYHQIKQDEKTINEILKEKDEDENSQNSKKSILPIENQNIKSSKIISKLNETSFSENSSNKLIIDKSHEQFRKLMHKEVVDDSLSYSEGNRDNYLDLDEDNYTIDPDGTFKHIWEYFIILTVCYYIILYPLFLAFSKEETFIILFINILLDIVYIGDLILYFFIGFYTFEEELIKNLSLIFKEYVNSGYFIINLFSSIPLGIILGKYGDNKLFDRTNLLLFLKLVKIGNIIQDNEKRNYLNFLFLNGILLVSDAFQRMIKFFFIFLIITHFISCIWIFLATLNPGENWIIKKGIQDVSNGEIYLNSLYFHWTSIFTIGYGDILAANLDEKVYNCLLLFVGILVYSYTISSLGSMLTSRDDETSKYEANINFLEELRTKNNIPKDFYYKLVKHFKYNLRYSKAEKNSFINDLPNRIRIQLLANMHREMIQKSIFFKEHSLEYASKVVYLMKPIRAMKKEKIINKGEYLVEIFFIRHGRISIHLDEEYFDKKIMDLRKNEYFGDILVEINERCPFNVKVSSRFCDLLALKKEDFNEIKEEFPEELSESLVVSYYNYQSLLELAENKKRKIKEEIQKWKKEDNKINDILNSPANKLYSFKSVPNFNKLNTFDNFSEIHENTNINTNNIESFVDKLSINQTRNSRISNIIKTNFPENIESKNPQNEHLINFNLIIQNNNFIDNNIKKEKTALPSKRRASLPDADLDLSNNLPPLLNPKRKRDSYSNSNINHPNKLYNEYPMSPSRKTFLRGRQMIGNLDLHKIQQSEMFIKNMMENKKKYNQLETNPEQFLLDGMKNMLNEKVQNENQQNEKLKDLFGKLCVKFGIDVELNN